MIINNKEIKFLRTVSATCDIADLCEDGSLENYTKLFEGPQSQVIKAKAKIIVALNNGYEINKALEDSEYKASPITVEQVLALTSDDFIALFDEAFDALFYSEEAKPTVETEPSKKEEAEVEGK